MTLKLATITFRCNLWINKKIGWDRLAGHVTVVVGDCRRIRLRKLIGRLYAARA